MSELNVKKQLKIEMILTKDDLDENTLDFLSSLPKQVHMSWSEWAQSARNGGLDENEIATLEQYLEQSNQLTSPMRFAGRQWWLTKQEIQHIEVIKQCFPESWQTEVLDRMQTKLLGYINKDLVLKARKKTKRL